MPHAADGSAVPADPQPRSIRGVFNLAATSPTYSPQELVAEVQRVLTMLNIFYVQVRVLAAVLAMATFVHIMYL